MKNKKKELNVDSIGGQGSPMTHEEELAISNFIKKIKDKKTTPSMRRAVSAKKSISQ